MPRMWRTTKTRRDKQHKRQEGREVRSGGAPRLDSRVNGRQVEGRRGDIGCNMEQGSRRRLLSS